MLYEPPNRGGKTIGAFNRGVGGNDPGSVTNQRFSANTFLMPQGYSISFSGWDCFGGHEHGELQHDDHAAGGEESERTSITGPSYEYIVNGGRFVRH